MVETHKRKRKKYSNNKITLTISNGEHTKQTLSTSKLVEVHVQELLFVLSRRFVMQQTYPRQELTYSLLSDTLTEEKLYKLYSYLRQEGYVIPGVCLFVYV